MELRVLNFWACLCNIAFGVAASISIAWFAFHQFADHFLYYASLLFLALICASAGLLFVSLLTLKAAVRRGADKPLMKQEECGCPFWLKTADIIPQMKWTITQSETWMSPALEKLADGRMLARRRGVFDTFRVQFAITDLLGLAAFQIELSGPAKFMIFPAQSPALGGIFEDLYSPGDTADASNGPPEGDLLEMDQHQRGQPMRHFVWKAYFRSGGRIRLVRKPEPAASYTRAYFFLPFGDDEPGATLARMLLDGKLDGEKWWFSTPGSARLMGPQDREAALLSLTATSGWQGDVAAETRRFGSMAKSNFAGSGGAVVIASHSVSREEEWTAKLRLAMNELASLSPTILVAVHAGAVFIPPSFLSEFGLARTVEIDLAKCLSTSMAA